MDFLKLIVFEREEQVSSLCYIQEGLEFMIWSRESCVYTHLPSEAHWVIMGWLCSCLPTSSLTHLAGLLRG